MSVAEINQYIKRRNMTEINSPRNFNAFQKNQVLALFPNNSEVTEKTYQIGILPLSFGVRNPNCGANPITCFLDSRTKNTTFPTKTWKAAAHASIKETAKLIKAVEKQRCKLPGYSKENALNLLNPRQGKKKSHKRPSGPQGYRAKRGRK